MLFRTVLVSALAVIPAGAQSVDSFRELAELVELGEDVRVTHRGQVLEGRALDISPTSLTVLAGGVPLELDEAAVTRIRQRSPRCRTLVSSSSRRRFSEACLENELRPRRPTRRRRRRRDRCASRTVDLDRRLPNPSATPSAATGVPRANTPAAPSSKTLRGLRAFTSEAEIRPGRRDRLLADAPPAPKSVTASASDSTPGWPDV